MASALFVAKEAKKAVIVVPIFAPRSYGKIFLRLNTPVAARGTTRDVVIELLWIMAVNSMPKISALAVVLKIYWSKNSSIL